MFTNHRSALALAIAALCCLPAAAATPVPGGANQVSAVSGNLGDTVFNGVLRVTVTDLRDATAADNPAQMNPSASQKVMVLKVLLKNGAHDEFTDLISYTLADKDSVTFAIPTNALQNANLHILQGGAERQSEVFLVDKDFVPTKLIVQCETCGSHSAFRAIRFTIPSK